MNPHPQRRPSMVADLLARHEALLGRVTVLEQALEKILKTEELADDSHEFIYACAREALDG